MQVGPVDSKAAHPSREELKLKQACRDFEAIFMSYLMKSMRRTVSKSDLLDSGIEGEFFQEMMDTEFCKAAANAGTMGIAEMIYRQLSRSLDETGTIDKKRQ